MKRAVDSQWIHTRLPRHHSMNVRDRWNKSNTQRLQSKLKFSENNRHISQSYYWSNHFIVEQPIQNAFVCENIEQVLCMYSFASQVCPWIEERGFSKQCWLTLDLLHIRYHLELLKSDILFTVSQWIVFLELRNKCFSVMVKKSVPLERMFLFSPPLFILQRSTCRRFVRWYSKLIQVQKDNI